MSAQQSNGPSRPGRGGGWGRGRGGGGHHVYDQSVGAAVAAAPQSPQQRSYRQQKQHSSVPEAVPVKADLPADGRKVVFPWDASPAEYDTKLSAIVPTLSTTTADGRTPAVEAIVGAMKRVMMLNPDRSAFTATAAAAPSPSGGGRGGGAAGLGVPPLRFDALALALDEAGGEFTAMFAAVVLPWMGAVLTDAKAQFPNGLPTLPQITRFSAPNAEAARKPGEEGADQRLLLTKQQVATLLVMGFFSLFPSRFIKHGITEEGTATFLPSFNFLQLFSCSSLCAAAKTRCILQYFVATHREWEEVVGTATAAGMAVGGKKKASSAESLAPAAAAGAPLAPPSLSTTAASGPLYVEILRHALPAEALGTLLGSDGVYDVCLSSVPMDYRPQFPIEHCAGAFHADFANEWIGGGALRQGCVQEEILFAQCPELLVSLLVCEKLLDSEAVVISGARQFTQGVGYGNGYRYDREVHSTTRTYNPPIVTVPCGPNNLMKGPPSAPTHCRMLSTAVVAFDALNFNRRHPMLQFGPLQIDRELLKALSAMRAMERSALSLAEDRSAAPPTTTSMVTPSMATAKSPVLPQSVPSPNAAVCIRPFATGNWGCGVFAGDRGLKFLIQWIAAAAVRRRPMIFCAFGSDCEMRGVVALHRHMEGAGRGVSVGSLYRIIKSYAADSGAIGREVDVSANFVEYVISKTSGSH